ncbi:MAG: efflux RND transporter periplasmic adaptor subunit [Candidatus Latescibacterota bacterium]
MSKTFVPLAAALAPLLALVACSGPAAPPAATAPVPVRVAMADTLATRVSVNASGVTAAPAEVQLSFGTGGTLARLLVGEGDTVRRGSLLAELDLTETRAGVVQARAVLDKARRDLAIAEQLFADSALARDRLLDARTVWESSQAAAEVAAHRLAISSLAAPVTGRVLLRLAEPGETVAAGQPVLTLVPEEVVIRAGLTDRDLLQVTIGDPATVVFPAFPETAWQATVLRLPAGADPRTGLYEVELAVAADRPLLPGMVVRIAIQTGHWLRWPAVPVESLVNADGDRGYVYVLEGRTVRRRLVTLGQLIGDRVLVIAGLSAGDTVVREGATRLRDSTLVEVVPDDRHRLAGD